MLVSAVQTCRIFAICVVIIFWDARLIIPLFLGFPFAFLFYFLSFFTVPSVFDWF